MKVPLKPLLFVAAMFVAPALFGSAGCEKMKAQEEAAKPGPLVAPEKIPGPEGVSMSPGTVATIVAGPASFDVWVAESEEERLKGLQKRESLAENQGMWFVFPTSENYSFWMKDTSFPLDWIFVDADPDGELRVVDIKANNQPMDETLYAPKVPFRHALEVRGGQAASKGIKVGDSVQVRIGPK